MLSFRGTACAARRQWSGHSVDAGTSREPPTNSLKPWWYRRARSHDVRFARLCIVRGRRVPHPLCDRDAKPLDRRSGELAECIGVLGTALSSCEVWPGLRWNCLLRVSEGLGSCFWRERSESASSIGLHGAHLHWPDGSHRTDPLGASSSVVRRTGRVFQHADVDLCTRGTRVFFSIGLHRTGLSWDRDILEGQSPIGGRAALVFMPPDRVDPCFWFLRCGGTCRFPSTRMVQERWPRPKMAQWDLRTIADAGRVVGFACMVVTDAITNRAHHGKFLDDRCRHRVVVFELSRCSQRVVHSDCRRHMSCMGATKW